MALFHFSDIQDDFFPLVILALSGKKAVETIGNDFRLPELMQQRWILFRFHRDLVAS
jgi:hypothetical protein